MHHRLLRLELDSISPEVKFFLVRFLQLYSLDDSVSLGIKALAQAIGVTDRIVTRSITELEALQLLIHRKIVTGRGRPRSEYQCSARLEKLLEDNRDPVTLVHKSRIDHLLHSANQMHGEKLSITNRLLLAVLLSHSDLFGAVRDQSLSDLSRKTGLNRERVKSQIYKLNSLGIIRSWIHGATNAQLFGPTKSIYFLNLHHLLLSQGGHPAITIVYPFENLSYNKNLAEAGMILHKSINIKRPEFFLHYNFHGFLPSDNKFNKLYELFEPNALNLLVSKLLQAKIEEYASMLLSKFWNTELLTNTLLSKTENTNFFIDEEILRRIDKDFKSTIGTGSQSDTDDSSNLLSEFIYQVAFCLARKIQKLPSIIDEISDEKVDFLILFSAIVGDDPRLYKRSILLLAMPRREDSERKCYIFTGSNDSQQRFNVLNQEDDISLEDRYKYGLITKVKVPKRYGLSR